MFKNSKKLAIVFIQNKPKIQIYTLYKLFLEIFKNKLKNKLFYEVRTALKIKIKQCVKSSPRTQHPIVKNMQNNAFLHMELKHQKNTFVNFNNFI